MVLNMPSLEWRTATNVFVESLAQTTVDSVSCQIVIAYLGVLEARMKVAVEVVILLYLLVRLYVSFQLLIQIYNVLHNVRTHAFIQDHKN